MKTFKYSLVLRTRENTDVFITLDDNIYGIHRKRVYILYLFFSKFIEVWPQWVACKVMSPEGVHINFASNSLSFIPQ